MIISLAENQVNLITQVFALISCSYLLRRVLRPLKLPSVVAELITGILFGPSFFGLLFPTQQAWLFPKVANSGLSGLAQMGSLLLLILAGLEIERKKIHGKKIFIVSLWGIVVPFLLGFVTAPFLMVTTTSLDNLLFSLFLGTAMSISAVSVMAKMFLDMNIIGSKIAQFSLPAAMTDDVVGWIVLSVITSMATLKQFDLLNFAQICSTTLLFVISILYFGPKLMAYVFRVSSQKLIVAMIMCTMMASLAILLKIEPILGSFLTAIVFPEEVKSEIKSTLNKIISGIFAPIFFAIAGLKVDLSFLTSLEAVKLTLIIIGIACVGKLVGVYLGGRLVHIRHTESIAMAWAMNTRGSQEIIVASIGLKLNIISQPIYTSIIAMSVVTNLIAAPMIRRYMAEELPLSTIAVDNAKSKKILNVSE